MDKEILNLNVGILGHVDSGKTSLAKTISVVSSTASFDKNPQSKERGITIDLGFSAVSFDIPCSLKAISANDNLKHLQFTFVDCPGHASLIRTVIGGAQIIDMMILVVDITKGIQTQTAECLVIGEITCPKMLVVLNKLDLVPEKIRQQTITKVTKKMKLTLANTIFKEAPIVCIAAKPGGAEAEEALSPIGINELIETLKGFAFIPERNTNKPFVFAMDHCFAIRGQGTVMTGTILQGSVFVNDVVEIPLLNVTKKIKSMQVYRQNVESAKQGDRVGICITQLDAKQLERGIVCLPGFVPLVYAVIIQINKVKYFKAKISSKAKFHISIGYETLIGRITIFSSQTKSGEKFDDFDFMSDYFFLNDFYEPNLNDDNVANIGDQFALIEFEKPIFVVPNSLVIGSKLDLDIYTNTCRLAFHGNVVVSMVDKNYTTTILPKLKVFKLKSKTGQIDRVVNEFEIIGKNMFKKETKIELFSNLKVNLSSGEEGVIEQSFGKSGKFRIRIPQGLKESTVKRYAKKSKSDSDQCEVRDPIHIVLQFKKYIYDTKNKIMQR